MSRSRKKVAGGTWCCNSQKKGKRFCNRKFRRMEHALIAKGRYDRLPYNVNEAMGEWELGGDGKYAWFFNLNDSKWLLHCIPDKDERNNYYLKSLRK